MKKSILILTILFIGIFYSCEDEFDSRENLEEKIDEENLAPTAVLKIDPEEGTTSTTFTFRSWESDDPESKPLSARLDFEGDGIWDTDFYSCSVNKTHVYTSEGTYYPKLQVKDEGNLTDEVSSKVVVEKEYFNIVLYSTQDVYVCSLTPDQNYNSGQYEICLKLAPEGSYNGENRIYLNFDLEQIPKNAIIDEAIIFCINMGAVNNSDTKDIAGALMIEGFLFNSVNSNWNESTITWNSDLNQKVSTIEESGWLFAIDGEDAHLEVSVIYDVKSYLMGDTDNFQGWVIRTFESNSSEALYEYKTFVSQNYNGESGPKLYIKYHFE